MISIIRADIVQGLENRFRNYASTQDSPNPSLGKKDIELRLRSFAEAYERGVSIIGKEDEVDKARAILESYKRENFGGEK